MPALPVTLSLEGQRCVIIGGGAVALRRAAALLDAGAIVAVIAPRIDPALAALPIEAIERPYQTGDLAGAFLAIAATDRRAVNDAVAAEAKERGILLNRADDSEGGNLRFPTFARLGSITVSVDSGASMPGAATAIRDELVAALHPGWPELLAIAQPVRNAIIEAVSDRERRRALIQRLTDHEAIALFRMHGSSAYRAHCQAILASAYARAIA